MRYSEEEKKMWMDDWAESGLSAWAYSRKNGLNLQTFLGWARPKVEENHCFVEIPATPVSLQADKGTMRTPEILIEKGDVKIHIPLAISRTELHAVIEGLGAAL